IPTANWALLESATTLWSATGPRDSAAMDPFIRYLALRALAAREEDAAGGPGWSMVFTTLCDRAAEDGDLAGRLHHELALRAVDEVAGELAELLMSTSGDEWLQLLDHVVATPDICHDRGRLHPAGQTNGECQVVARLITALRAGHDPGLSKPDERR